MPVAGPTLPLLLLFLLGAAPTFARDLWNIACGGNETFVSANNLTFEGDAPYIRSGERVDVPAAARDGLSREFSTLRAFPPAPWRKSCYRIPVEQGTKVLVRTSFYYGNYDGLNLPPQFDVYYDTVEYGCAMSLSGSEPVSCEEIYLTTKKQGTDICFVRTESDQSPIVSTIEVSRLPSNMYGFLDFSKYALFGKQRLAFGADRDISYPDDAYNRNWTLQGTEGAGVYKPIKRENTTAVDIRSADDSPPALLFQAAAVAPMINNQTATNLTIRTPWLPTDPTKIYLTMYFTEPVASNGISAQKKRLFNVYMDGKLISNSSDPIQPRYGFAKEFSDTLQDVSNETTFDLVPAKGSTLPPVISGMETLSISDVDNATDSNDVENLSTLQSSFTVLGSWTGDPCRPSDYAWEWLGCKYPDSSPPRINKLLFSGYQLSGNIPDFSALVALEHIDLSNNSFTGRVPEFIATLPNLQTLDLSFTGFDGIPASLLDNRRITLIATGNSILSNLIPSSPSPPGTRTSSATNAYNKVRSSKFALFILILAMVSMM